jgi:hypothetical protein
MISAVSLSGDGHHVVIMPRNGLGHEKEIAAEARDCLAVKAGRLMFPDHRSGVSRQDQVGARKPSTSTVCSRAAASFASSTVGLSSSVDASISGVNFATIPEITGCEASNISAQTSWVMFCRI